MKNKKWIWSGVVIILVIVGGISLASLFKTLNHQTVYGQNELLELESKKSFEFFWNEATTDPHSLGYGLIADRAPGAPGISSVASVGFGLTAIPIAVERGWISEEEGHDRVSGTLQTLLEDAQHVNGFFYHFLDMKTAKRAWSSEVSIIDTAIAINGALTAGEYFGGEVQKKADELYKRVNWKWYVDPKNNQFYMGYSPEEGFKGHWDFYAEQTMLYFLAAASPTFPVDPQMFYEITRKVGSYGEGEPFIHSWHGSIFTYQFSHAWFDLRNKVDREGINWWENSVNATKANRQFVIDHADEFDTYGEYAWGLTASDGPSGYEGRYGASPSGYHNDQHYIDGTIPPAGAAGSIVFTPEVVVDTLQNYYDEYPDLWGKYGFKDAFNVEVSPHWYASDVIGIDKGITLLMIENLRTNFVWEMMNQNAYVQEGMRLVGFKEQ